MRVSGLGLLGLVGLKGVRLGFGFRVVALGFRLAGLRVRGFRAALWDLYRAFRTLELWGFRV